MNLFYTPDINGNTYQLDELESKHCIKVLRFGIGEILHLIDGKGGWYETRIIDPHPKKCTVEVISVKKEFGKRSFYSHIAIAPTKNIERIEWFLEKATEIGIDEISLFLCDHSERKIVKEDRLEKIMVSAMKQSLKAYLPILNKLTNFDDLMANDFEGSKFIAHCSEGDKDLLFQQILPGAKNLVLIGPEGDFSPREIDLARNKGFMEVSLGESRLRTETAGVVACHIIGLKNETT